MHQHNLEDSRGELTDTIPLCSDSCHRDLCEARGLVYDGWNGCLESPDYTAYCAQCGVVAGIGPDACQCQRDNVVVNRFLADDGEACEHGNWIQLPAHLLGRA
jgi:hypothetical protein